MVRPRLSGRAPGPHNVSSCLSASLPLTSPLQLPAPKTLPTTNRQMVCSPCRYVLRAPLCQILSPVLRYKATRPSPCPQEQTVRGDRDVSNKPLEHWGMGARAGRGTGPLVALQSPASPLLLFHTPFKMFFLDSYHCKLVFNLQSPAQMFPLP